MTSLSLLLNGPYQKRSSYYIDNWHNFASHADLDPFGPLPGPIFDEFGKLIAYVVAAGQGPTQIAKDLNDYYSCNLECTIDYETIVLDNSGNFENVIDADGQPFPKHDEHYKSGNIHPGDVLFINYGKQGEKEIELILIRAQKIQTLINQLDTAMDQKLVWIRGVGFNGSMESYHRMDPQSGGPGVTLGTGLTLGRLENDTAKIGTKQRKLEVIRDSILMLINDSEIRTHQECELRMQRAWLEIHERKMKNLGW